MEKNTFSLVVDEFGGAAIPLEAVSKKYFGIGSKEAARKASLHQLPIPAFRLASQAAGYFIDPTDLANYIDNKAQKAREEWQKMNN